MGSQSEITDNYFLVKIKTAQSKVRVVMTRPGEIEAMVTDVLSHIASAGTIESRQVLTGARDVDGQIGFNTTALISKWEGNKTFHQQDQVDASGASHHWDLNCAH